MKVINLTKIQTKLVILIVKISCLSKRLANVTFSGEKRNREKRGDYGASLVFSVLFQT